MCGCMCVYLQQLQYVGAGETGRVVVSCVCVCSLRAWWVFGKDFFRPCQMLNLVFLPVPAVSSTCTMKRHTQAHAALQLSHLSANTDGNNTLQVVSFISIHFISVFISLHYLHFLSTYLTCIHTFIYVAGHWWVLCSLLINHKSLSYTCVYCSRYGDSSLRLKSYTQWLEM